MDSSLVNSNFSGSMKRNFGEELLANQKDKKHEILGRLSDRFRFFNL